VASLFIAPVYEPVRRWGQKPGVLGVWASCEEGRKVLWSLSTTKRERYESCLEVLGGVAKRGMPVPVTLTTEGAIGLTTALEAMGPKSLRIRGWFHQRQTLHQQVPAPLGPEVKAVLVDRREAPTPEKAEKRREASGEQ
jgi:hypothetical protein